MPRRDFSTTPCFIPTLPWQEAGCAGAGDATAGTPCSYAVASDVLTPSAHYQIRLVAQNTVPSPASNAVDVFMTSDRSDWPPQPVNISWAEMDGTGRALGIAWLMPDTERGRNATLDVGAEAFDRPGLPPTSTAVRPGSCSASAQVAGYLSCAYTLEGLSPNTHYMLAVSARNDYGSSLASINATTPKDAPDAPASLAVTSADTNSVTLEWTAPADNGYELLGYVIQVESDVGAAPDVRLLSPDLSPIASGTRRALSSAGVTGCAALRAAPVGASGGGVAAHQAQSYVVDALPPATSFAILLYACNALNASDAACICNRDACAFSPACSSGTSAAIPPNTQGAPERPSPVGQDGSRELLAERVDTLFITWNLPYDNQLPISKTELRVDEGSTEPLLIKLPPSVTAYNLTGRRPATQHAAQVRMKNAQGWSDWSELSWLSTLPTEPEAPGAPHCDGSRVNASGVSFTTTYDQLLVQLVAPPTANGQPVECYEVSVVPASGSGVTAVSTPSTDAACSVTKCSSAPSTDPRYIYLATHLSGGGGGSGDDDSSPPFLVLANGMAGLAVPLEAGTRYNISSRAINSVGCSAWSAVSEQCATEPVPEVAARAPLTAGEEGAAISVPLLVFLITIGLLIVCCRNRMVRLWRGLRPMLKETSMGKILMRAKTTPQNEEVLTDFVSEETTTMEGNDKDMVLNPVILYEMKLKKERAMLKKEVSKLASSKSAAKNVDVHKGRSGGLARLNFQLEEKKLDPMKQQMAALDLYLEKDQGVVSGPAPLIAQSPTEPPDTTPWPPPPRVLVPRPIFEHWAVGSSSSTITPDC